MKLITFLDHISANMKERGPERKCLRNILVAGKSQSEIKNMPVLPKRRITRSNHIQNRLLTKRAWNRMDATLSCRQLPCCSVRSAAKSVTEAQQAP